MVTDSEKKAPVRKEPVLGGKKSWSARAIVIALGKGTLPPGVQADAQRGTTITTLISCRVDTRDEQKRTKLCALSKKRGKVMEMGPIWQH